MTSTSLKGTRARRSLTRRKFLKTAGGAAATIAAAKASFLSGVHIAQPPDLK